MSRYGKEVKLVASETVPDEGGYPVEVREYSCAFANPLTVGAQSWAAARSAGLHADASIRLRSCDYAGQQAVVMDGAEYEVERASCSGEFTDLTLRRRLGNG